MNKSLKNIEIVLARDEHIDGIKSTMKDFYLDEPVFKAQKIDVEKLNDSFFDLKKNKLTLVAVDKNNGAVVSVVTNGIVKSDNAARQKINAGEYISRSLYFFKTHNVKNFF